MAARNLAALSSATCGGGPSIAARTGEAAAICRRCSCMVRLELGNTNRSYASRFRWPTAGEVTIHGLIRKHCLGWWTRLSLLDGTAILIFQ